MIYREAYIKRFSAVLLVGIQKHHQYSSAMFLRTNSEMWKYG